MRKVIALTVIIVAAAILCLFVWWIHGRMADSAAEPLAPGLQSGTEDGSVGGPGSGGGGASGEW